MILADLRGSKGLAVRSTYMLRIVSDLHSHPPRFSVNADSKEFEILCFAALLQVLILRGLAQAGFWGLFES